MAKWSGRGQPPTKKKLHKWRETRRKERLALRRPRAPRQDGVDDMFRDCRGY